MPNAVDDAGRALPALDVARALAGANNNWTDLSWIRKAWDGPIVMKGLLRADDARRAVDEGVDGIVVSNHGGRQLDSAACQPARAARHRRSGQGQDDDLHAMAASAAAATSSRRCAWGPTRCWSAAPMSSAW